MVPPIRDLLLGSRFERRLDLLAAVTAGVLTFALYAAGVFTVEGGIVVLPGDATLVGLLLAASIGYGRRSLLGAWLGPFAAYIGFTADWAFFGLSARPLAARLAFLFDPVGLAVYGIAAVLLGSLAYAAGAGLAWAASRLGRAAGS